MDAALVGFILLEFEIFTVLDDKVLGWCWGLEVESGRPAAGVVVSETKAIEEGRKLCRSRLSARRYFEIAHRGVPGTLMPAFGGG